jgi:hypothetical protein
VGGTNDKLVLGHGGLVSWMFNKVDTSEETRCQWAIHIADALVSLHALHPSPRPHTTLNVLLSGNQVTLCDLDEVPLVYLSRSHRLL